MGRVASVLAFVLLAGCVGAGGAGGSADVDGGPVSPFYVRAGTGQDGQEGGWPGADGCNVQARGNSILFCGVGLTIQAGRIQVSSLDESSTLRWQDVRVAVREAGFHLRAAGVAVALDQASNISAAIASSQRDDPRFDPDVFERGAAEVLGDAVATGQVLEVCGVGTATTWIRDVRPTGAILGIELRADQCDGTPWQPPDFQDHAAYDLVIQSFSARLAGPDSRNCVAFSGQSPYTLALAATWTASFPGQDEVQFLVYEGDRLVERFQVRSPWTQVVESDGGPRRIVALLSDAAGTDVAVNPAALQVDLEVSATFHGRAGTLPDDAGYC